MCHSINTVFVNCTFFFFYYEASPKIVQIHRGAPEESSNPIRPVVRAKCYVTSSITERMQCDLYGATLL